MKTTSIYRGLLVAGLCTGLGAGTATGSMIILDDDFTDATMDNGVLQSVLDYELGARTSDHQFGVGTLDGDALHLGDGSGSIYITAALGQTVSLANVGDFIEMTFDFTTSGGERGNRVLRYGFFQGAEDDADATGYFLGGANQGDPDRSSDMNNILAVAEDRDDFYTTDRPSDRLEVGLTNVLLELPGEARFRVERISETEMLLSGEHDTQDFDGQTLTHTITADSATEIDELWFGIRSRDTNFTIDNLQVTMIPEPASVALLGAGGLLLLRRRSREA